MVRQPNADDPALAWERWCVEPATQQHVEARLTVFEGVYLEWDREKGGKDRGHNRHFACIPDAWPVRRNETRRRWLPPELRHDIPGRRPEFPSDSPAALARYLHRIKSTYGWEV